MTDWDDLSVEERQRRSQQARMLLRSDYPEAFAAIDEMTARGEARNARIRAVGGDDSFVLPDLREGSMHECPYPMCEAQVPAAMFACRSHWYSLPKPIRNDIWRAYADGEGIHSDELAEAHGRARIWWAENPVTPKEPLF